MPPKSKSTGSKKPPSSTATSPAKGDTLARSRPSDATPDSQPPKPAAKKPPANDAQPSAHAVGEPSATRLPISKTMQAVRDAASATAEEDTDPVVATLADLERLRQSAQAQLDKTKDEDFRGALNDLLDTISDARTALNQQSIEQHTISLQAAEAQLDPAIEQLEGLRDQLASIAERIAQAAKIADAVDAVVSGFKGVLATFGG